MKKVVMIFIITSVFSVAIFAQEYAVIVNKNMKQLSKSQIKAIFLKKLTFVDDQNVVPINLGATNPVRTKFEKEVLGMSFTRLKSYWTKQHYLGHRPPLTMKSSKSVKAFVKKVEGAIGYIDINSVDTGVNVVYKWRD